MKTKIKIIVNNKEVEVDFDKDEFLLKAKKRILSSDDIQKIIIYFFTQSLT